MNWRARVEHDYHFALDQLRLFVAKRIDTETIQPVQVEFRDLEPVESPAPIEYTLPHTIIPRELAEVLMNAFAGALLGTEGRDLIAENQRLKRELRHTNHRLDNLITGIGQLGGHKRHPDVS